MSSMALHRDGKYLKDANNQVVVLRGVNAFRFNDDGDNQVWQLAAGGVVYSEWSEDYVDQNLTAIQNYGCNCIRIIMTASIWQANSDNFRYHCQYVAEAALARGIYVIFCFWNTEPSGSMYPFSSMSGTQFASLWSSFANYLKGYPNAIFELWNEINPDDISIEDYAPLAQQAITAIRNTGSLNVICVNYLWAIFWNWTYNVGVGVEWVDTFAGLVTDPADRILYSVHHYRHSNLTNDPNSADGLTYTYENYDFVFHQLGIFDCSYPLIIGETGAINTEPSMGCTEPSLEVAAFENLTQLLNDHGIGYLVWTWAPGFWGWYIVDSDAGRADYPPNYCGQVLQARLAQTPNTSNDTPITSNPPIITSASITVTMNQNRTVEPVFQVIGTVVSGCSVIVHNQKWVTSGYVSGGGFTVPAEGTYTYNYGTYANFFAAAYSGFYFNNWIENGYSIFANPTQIFIGTGVINMNAVYLPSGQTDTTWIELYRDFDIYLTASQGKFWGQMRPFGGVNTPEFTTIAVTEGWIDDWYNNHMGVSAGTFLKTWDVERLASSTWTQVTDATLEYIMEEKNGHSEGIVTLPNNATNRTIVGSNCFIRISFNSADTYVGRCYGADYNQDKLKMKVYKEAEIKLKYGVVLVTSDENARNMMKWAGLGSGGWMYVEPNGVILGASPSIFWITEVAAFAAGILAGFDQTMGTLDSGEVYPYEQKFNDGYVYCNNLINDIVNNMRYDFRYEFRSGDSCYRLLSGERFLEDTRTSATIFTPVVTVGRSMGLTWGTYPTVSYSTVGTDRAQQAEYVICKGTNISGEVIYGSAGTEGGRTTIIQCYVPSTVEGLTVAARSYLAEQTERSGVSIRYKISYAYPWRAGDSIGVVNTALGLNGLYQIQRITKYKSYADVEIIKKMTDYVSMAESDNKAQQEMGDYVLSQG